jgi:hypothetical protein
MLANIHFTFLLALLLLYPLISQAQFTKKAVYQKVDSTLQVHLQAAQPHHHCPCNNCDHFYTGKLNLHSTGRTAVPLGNRKFEERFFVWGKASVSQVSPFLSSETIVSIYAELKELDNGEIELTTLKWKQNDCMQYVYLVEETNLVKEISVGWD